MSLLEVTSLRGQISTLEASEKRILAYLTHPNRTNLFPKEDLQAAKRLVEIYTQLPQLRKQLAERESELTDNEIFRLVIATGKPPVALAIARRHAMQADRS